MLSYNHLDNILHRKIENADSFCILRTIEWICPLKEHLEMSHKKATSYLTNTKLLNFITLNCYVGKLLKPIICDKNLEMKTQITRQQNDHLVCEDLASHVTHMAQVKMGCKMQNAGMQQNHWRIKNPSRCHLQRACNNGRIFRKFLSLIQHSTNGIE
ncbi:hypothetical protein T4D_2219 [Trichinella pseudospiralis]|uniref:Uncharacterized protein n=1 Tax=Trichinella pseudospiralis TaxID=6337 RepID=A0A0V1FUZ5_TRIPS|nr:hypothetical protein T4D_2219 [Trichinella pseudospiralis]